MLAAIYQRRIRNVIALINDGADVNDSSCCDGFLPLSLAARTGFVGMAKLLLKKGARINGLGDNSEVLSPITVAVISQKYAMCAFLVKHGANVNAVHRLPPLSKHNTGKEWITVHIVFCAIYHRRDRRILALLLANGADPNIYMENYAPLHYAAHLDLGWACDLLLAFGANVFDRSPRDNLTALERSERNRNTNALKSLVQYSGGTSVKESYLNCYG